MMTRSLFSISSASSARDLGAGAVELRVLVDAVVDDVGLAELAGHPGRRRDEGVEERIAEAERAHRALDRRRDGDLVHFAGEIRTVVRNRQRRDGVDVRRDVDGARGQVRRELAELVDDAAEIARGRARRAVAERVDPQDAVVLRQPRHHVLLRQRIAGPVVGEADDVAAGERHATSRIGSGIGRAEKFVVPQLEHDERPQLGRQIGAGLMARQERADDAEVEAVARERARIGERVVGEIVEAAAQPRRRRRAEAHLGAIEDRLRHAADGRFAQQRLADAAVRSSGDRAATRRAP